MQTYKHTNLILGLILAAFILSTSLARADTTHLPGTTANEINTSALEKVTLQLKWAHQFQFAGYYAAQLKGYYRDEGLDVTINPRDPYKNNIQQVIDGEVEYSISDSSLLLYQARNEPVVIVAPIFQHSPQAVATLKSSGIDTP